MRYKEFLLGAGMGLTMGTLLLGLPIGKSLPGCQESRRQEQEHFRQQKFLVEKCLETASGTNQVLENLESLELARELGYEKILFEGDKATLSPPNNPGYQATLSIEDLRDIKKGTRSISAVDMYCYLNKLNPKAIEAFKLYFPNEGRCPACKRNY